MAVIRFSRAAGGVLGGFVALVVYGCAGGDVASTPQLSAATPASLSGGCESLARRLATLPDTTVTGSSAVPAGTLKLAGQDIPEHCRVTGRMFERVSPVDGKTYSIQFEMRLPKAWNGRFLHQGNGGIDGSVVTAQGNFGGGPTTNALLQGFAVLSSDAGHTNAQGGPAFGIDPQARLDYGYQAAMKLTPVAKSIVATAYGKGPDRSYFAGCSNGGRHTLVAAARMPDQYDGYLAGAPGYRLPLAAVANIFGAQRYASVATGDPKTAAGLETAFTQVERTMVSRKVLEKCDALDGLTDGLVQDTNACQAAFSFERDVPTCTGARDGTCLSAAQKTAIAPIFSGATTSDGKPFYASFPFDSGHGSPGVASWEFTNSLLTDRDPGAVGMIFKVPPVSPTGFDGPAFTLNSNIDTLVAQINATNATYTEPAMGFMTPPNAADLSAVRNRGAKVIVYHGVSDAIFSVNDTETLYKSWQANNGGDASDFARFYRVPGMGHCSGGPATDQFDLLTPLVQWVEEGRAPGAVVAQARGPGNAGGVNTEVPAGWAADRTRPLCPYPRVARYDGSGDPEKASSFSCR